MKNSYAEMTYAELVAKRDDLRREALNLRMAKVLGHVENPLAIRTTRRDIARLKTLIHEYALGIRTKSN